ncbi:MAG: carboxypeptidase regulatory-like domain-containing protein [Sedimentisphaerales bacterium]|nr:carboxypeptidase regulatory-like domain-containing protein [Sedimentisphaerales bacterium]
MNRRGMILLAVTITTFAITCRAADYDMTRLSPTEASLTLPTSEEGIVLVGFKALFSLHWGYGWNKAEWWVDGESVYTDTALGANDGITWYAFSWSDLGTHVVKVRAQYDSIPFGVDVWTSYLSWTVTVVSRNSYTVERVEPAEASCSVPLTTYPVFRASFGGLVSQAAWDEARWYVNGELKRTEALSGQTAESFYYPSFTAVGTYEVKVNGQYTLGGVTVTTSDLTWTVEVVPHPPTASRVSPASPVTLQQGGTQAFTARGTDPGSEEDTLDIAGVRWYLDGVQQGDFEFGTIVHSSIEHTWNHTFDTGGTYQVEAVFYDYEGYSSAGGQAVWTVVVEQQAHPPSATIVSPSSPVTVYAGASVTFEVTGTDAGNDLRLCEVLLDDVHQTDASFSGTASGSTAEWTHTFNTPGTYHVGFIPVDLAGDHGSACTWTVKVEGHDPSGTIVSPSSPVTVNIGVPVTFTFEGADPADDLWLCEVSLDGVIQTHAYFSGPASGSTAEWTHALDTPGTYYVGFTPLDSANKYGTAEVWTVVVEDYARQAGLSGVVVELDAQGRAQGPLAGAKVDLAVPATGTATTDGQGKFAFTGLNPGTYTANVSKTGYYTQSRGVSLGAGETKDEVFQLTPESLEPVAFDFSSPGGKHFVEGLPGDLSFSVMVAWNGSPGLVRFDAAGTWHTATVTDLGADKALASLSIPAPATIPECSELEVEVSNGEGKRVTVNTGVYLYPSPSNVSAWLMNAADILPWEASAETKSFSFKMEQSHALWDISTSSGKVSSEAVLGYELQLTFDPWAGKLSGLTGGFGRTKLKMDTSSVELLGEGRIDLTGNLAITFAGSNPPTVIPSWRLSYAGKAGVGAPVVNAISIVFPPAAPAIETLKKTPVVGDLVKSLKVRLYLIVGGALIGEYDPDDLPAECWFGTTSVSGSITLGLEGQVVVAFKRWGWKLEAGVYAGGTGTPELQICPEWEFEGVTLRAYVGVFVSSWSYRFSREVAMTVVLGDGGQQKIMALSALPGSDLEGGWQPIGDSCLRWGEMNVLAGEGGSGGRFHALSVQGEIPQETRLVENVVPTASPVLLSGPSERLILFCLHDPNKPWYAATDIGTLRQMDDQPWELDRITDDQAAEFGPSVVAADSGTSLAAWERVSGDISDTNEPGQIAPHMEIATASFDRNTGTWSTPEQLTSNAVADHQPVPITLGMTRGILWIANEGSAAIGDANSGDRLMFAKWSGGGWDEPQTLWSARKGIMDFAFLADSFHEGHLVLTVDEDGDPNTTTDCELYLLWTAEGAWQTAIQLTGDFVEDAMPTLVAPNGVPMCVWSADGTLVYSELYDWNPRPVYSEYTLANEAPSLDGVTMPGGAAIAYTVQGPDGMDIVASFYDADLDCWSLPRQLTADEHAETALSLTCDGGELVIAYLKTQTLRTDMEVEIEGQMHRLENIPQPGRTDLYVLRHTLADDLAVVSESMVVEPANPVPGTAATILAAIENRGDLPLQDVEVVFYDGDPSNGGVAIGDRQVISGTLIAGGKENVSVSWNVPLNQSSHEIFVAVDPCLVVEDRDRSNNELLVRTVLPDLAIETCWSTEVSSTTMALTARVVNTGVVPASAFDVSWRLGAADGEEIGTSTIESLIADGAHEVTFIWDTDGRLGPGQQAQVFAVADSTGSVPEFDDTNNVYSLAVFHPPGAP